MKFFTFILLCITLNLTAMNKLEHNPILKEHYLRQYLSTLKQQIEDYGNDNIHDSNSFWCDTLISLGKLQVFIDLDMIDEESKLYITEGSTLLINAFYTSRKRLKKESMLTILKSMTNLALEWNNELKNDNQSNRDPE